MQTQVLNKALRKQLVATAWVGGLLNVLIVASVFAPNSTVRNVMFIVAQSVLVTLLLVATVLAKTEWERKRVAMAILLFVGEMFLLFFILSRDAIMAFVVGPVMILLLFRALKVRAREFKAKPPTSNVATPKS